MGFLNNSYVAKCLVDRWISFIFVLPLPTGNKAVIMNEIKLIKLSGVGKRIAFSLPTTKIRVRFPGSTIMATLMTDVGRCRFSDVWQPSYLNFYSAKIRVAKTIQFPTSDIHEGPCCRLQQGV